MLSQALFSEFKRHGTAFLPRYEAFLRTTGTATCEDAVRSTLGWDLTAESFWTGAITSACAPIKEFARVAASR
ncbi:MAG: hypothetical protein IT582_05840 [Opitutaceae bacterium]|nr:hypothetical protein [Opitutaceae bacterium]